MGSVFSQLFERLACWEGRFPDRVAHQTASAGRTPTLRLTYRELLARARAVAAHVRATLPPDGSPVVVLGHKEPEMLAGFLGVLGSGHPYIPVDDSLPGHRLQEVERIAGAALVLTPEIIAGLPPAAAEFDALQPDTRVYTIFTSGSTGEPKGVVITVRCLDAFLDWTLGEHAFAEGGETFLNQAPFSFDLSVMDLYLSLTTGGTLYSLTRREIADFVGLFRTLSAANPSVWVSTPSFAHLCLAERTFDAARLPAMRHFLFCGETLLTETAGRLLDRFPAAEVWNTYGPTEATVATTSIQITREIVARGGALPIGRAMPGTEVFLQHDDGTRPPDGERGEIIIAGPNVSPGYLGRPDLTAKAFFEHGGTRAYRTGDCGTQVDGLLYFDGRQDSQVKFHGYRIELADIEENFRALADVHECAVVLVNKGGAMQFLVAFVVPDGACPDAPAEVAAATDRYRAALAERLPAYMLPRKIYLRPALPLTANGKADRRRLVEIAANGGKSLP